MLIHGGDVVSYEQEYGTRPLDFSANVNPLGLPAGVRRAVEFALPTADAYPDPLCRKLTEALAQHRGVSPSSLLFGNGAADVLFRIVLAAQPRRALLPAPTFAEYEMALRMAGCEVDRHRLAPPDFQFDEAFLEAMTAEHAMVFVCNPNNPTGQLMPPTLMQKIVERSGALGIRLVVDECFVGFVEEPERHSVQRLLADNPHLVIVDAFTKLYGMAGIRLGYSMGCDEAFLEKMRAAGPPWAVSSLAQAAGVAALQEGEYIASSLALVAREKEFLLDGLRSVDIHPLGHAANYIFFACDTPRLEERLRDVGILLRSCANYHGLSSCHYRIAVRNHEENERLIAALQKIGV